MKISAGAVSLSIALALFQSAVQARPLPITRERAEAKALSLVAGGTIVLASLEREQGAPVWWFDLSVPGSRNVRSIRIDANTGRVVSNTVESPVDR